MPRLKPLFDTPQAYYDELVRASAAGEFPSMNAKMTSCAYRGQGKSRGRKCAIGKLIPDEVPVTAATETEGQEAIYDFMQEPWWPDWLSKKQAIAVQACHDEVQAGTDAGALSWNHADFLDRLNDCEVFQDCTRVFPELVV